MCGGQIFNVTAQMRCCNDKPCVGRGGWKYGHWSGEGDEEGRLICAECSGTPLKLEEACNQNCNEYGEDPCRNAKGVVRRYVACDANNITITLQHQGK